MQTAIEPKSENIFIKDFKGFYEIHFDEGNETILWLNRREMTMLRNKITEVLKEDIEVDKRTDMFRETGTHIEEVNRVGGFDKDFPLVDNNDNDGEY